jgi:hypothetical protein
MTANEECERQLYNATAALPRIVVYELRRDLACKSEYELPDRSDESNCFYDEWDWRATLVIFS